MTLTGVVLLGVTLGYLGLGGGPALVVTVALFGMLGALFLKEKIDAMPKKPKLAMAGAPSAEPPASVYGPIAPPKIVEAKAPESDD